MITFLELDQRATNESGKAKFLREYIVPTPLQSNHRNVLIRSLHYNEFQIRSQLRTPVGRRVQVLTAYKDSLCSTR